MGVLVKLLEEWGELGAYAVTPDVDLSKLPVSREARLIQALLKAREQRDRWMKQAIETAADKTYDSVTFPREDAELLKILKGEL